MYVCVCPLMHDLICACPPLCVFACVRKQASPCMYVCVLLCMTSFVRVPLRACPLVRIFGRFCVNPRFMQIYIILQIWVCRPQHSFNYSRARGDGFFLAGSFLLTATASQIFTHRCSRPTPAAPGRQPCFSQACSFPQFLTPIAIVAPIPLAGAAGRLWQHLDHCRARRARS
jgi:hypothetical protein